jgi:hypothetical protein
MISVIGHAVDAIAIRKVDPFGILASCCSNSKQNNYKEEDLFHGNRVSGDFFRQSYVFLHLKSYNDEEFC